MSSVQDERKIHLQLPSVVEPLLAPARYKVLHGGRGSGKSWAISRLLVFQAYCQPLRVLCARETQKSIGESVHELLRTQIAALGLEDQFEIQETRIIGCNGSEFAFAGLRQQNVANIKSFEGFDRVWVEEAQVVTKKSWDILTPTVRKPGSEIWVSFNPELDTDETYQRFVASPPAGAVVINMNYTDNPWFTPELEAERLDTLKRDPVGYRTIWEGQCRPAVEGAIYAAEIEAAAERIRPVPIDPLLKTHAVFDLGWNDAMAIVLVQKQSSELRIVGYIEDSHRTLADYSADLQAMRLNWGQIYLPHDGKAKNIQTGQSAQEIMQALGWDVTCLPQDNVEDGIRAARLTFPRIFFDKSKTGRLVECLKRYRRQVNSKTDEPGAPVHDEYSHGADAFRYVCMAAEQMSNSNGFGGPIKYPSLRAAR